MSACQSSSIRPPGCVPRSWLLSRNSAPTGTTPVPWFVDDVDRPALSDPAAFGAYVARLLGERAEPGVREGFVPATTLWWASGERFLGRLAIRHRLTPALETMGGHIGYDVRPGARRQGYATAMLAAALRLPA
jgi:predicted acetyltransferase